MTGVSERSVESSRLAQRSAMPAVACGAAGSAGTTSQWAEVEALLQPRRQFHAGGDGMFETEGDEPLGEAQRDQPLRGGARDLEHLGDLVLGVTGNEIEPAGTRGVVEPGLFVLGGHGGLCVLPEIAHAREDPIGPGTRQYSLAVAPAIMAAADKSPDGHAGRLRRLHAAGAVLDHQRARRARAHLLRRVEKEIGRRLAVPDHLRRVDPVAEMGPAGRSPSSESATRSMSLDEATQNRHAQSGQDGIDIGNRMERLLEGGQYARLQPDRKIGRHRLAEFAIMLRDRARASSEKQLERLREGQRYPRSGQLVGPGTGSSRVRCRRARRRSRR